MMIDKVPWFVGRDVAVALGYSNPRKTLGDHVDDEDKNTVTIRDGIQGNPNMTVINESGLYSLIFSSKLPAAKRFKHWVTNEVLPAIRKTGEYRTAATQDEVTPRELTSDDYFRAASIVATCKNERLPYVLSYLKMAGISAAYADQLKGKDDGRDKYEVMRLLTKAYSEYGISDAAIGRATGLARAQISMYRSGNRFPKAGRAEYIKAVVTPMINDEE
ncbi:MAG: BRO family protein [Oscillospiraceae bacterium]|nr:BRO family protein [Oscillospiraceae bacterium]